MRAPATVSAHGLELVGHHDLNGYGDGMQVMRHGDALYVGHTGTSGMGTTILDVADVTAPVLVDQWRAPAYTHSHKVQVADGLLLTNYERFPYKPTGPMGEHRAGMSIFRIDADPFHPEPIGFWNSGGRGVHRIVYEGGSVAHVSVIPEGFRDRIWSAIDLTDPSRPALLSRWWHEGQWEAGGEELPPNPPGRDHFRIAAHHALLEGSIAYLGYDDANLIVLDVSDFRQPVEISRLYWGGGATHTAMPLLGRGLLVVTDEQQSDGPGAHERRMHVIDVADPAAPRYRATIPAPVGDYDALPKRYGPHNLHENRAGSYQSDSIVVASYFSAGVRVYDLSDPDAPEEIAHWVPDAPPGEPVTQINDLFVDADLTIWATERATGGVYALRPDAALAQRMEAARRPAPGAAASAAPRRG